MMMMLMGKIPFMIFHNKKITLCIWVELRKSLPYTYLHRIAIPGGEEDTTIATQGRRCYYEDDYEDDDYTRL